MSMTLSKVTSHSGHSLNSKPGLLTPQSNAISRDPQGGLELHLGQLFLAAFIPFPAFWVGSGSHTAKPSRRLLPASLQHVVHSTPQTLAGDRDHIGLKPSPDAPALPAPLQAARLLLPFNPFLSPAAFPLPLFPSPCLSLFSENKNDRTWHYLLVSMVIKSVSDNGPSLAVVSFGNFSNTVAQRPPAFQYHASCTRLPLSG